MMGESGRGDVPLRICAKDCLLSRVVFFGLRVFVFVRSDGMSQYADLEDFGCVILQPAQSVVREIMQKPSFVSVVMSLKLTP